MIVGSRIIKLDTVDSTNNYAAKLLLEGKQAEGTAILASFQEKGRGQRGAKWQSNAEENMLMSVILYPDSITPENGFLISMTVSISVLRFLNASGIPNATIKWPNDILVQRKKIGGILIENSIRGNRIESSIIGVGLNVNQSHFDNLKATSMKMELNETHNTFEIALGVMREIDEDYKLLKKQSFSEIRNAYTENLLGVNEVEKYQIGDKVLSCKIDSIADNGMVTLLCNGKLNGPFSMGDIKWIQS